MFFKNEKAAPEHPSAGASENPIEAPANAHAAEDQGEIIFEVSTVDFESRVIHASMTRPVIAYFSAPWCGPCKQLAPAMEAAVRAEGGQVALAKINIDENQDLAAALRVQSVPTVFGFCQGKARDVFQGVVPPSKIQEFIAKLLEVARQSAPDAPDIAAALKAAAEALAEGDLQSAHGIYTQILQYDNNNTQAYVGLVRTFIAAEKIEEASELVKNAPDLITKNRLFAEAQSALELAQQNPADNINDLAQKLENNPDDHQSRFDLALAQFRAGDKEQAIENLLEILRRDREWNEEAARSQILKFFEALGAADPLTMQSRRKLSSILFS